MILSSFERKRILLVGGTLSLIGGIAALLIGAANALTAPVIAANDLAAQEAAMKSVYSAYASAGDPITIHGASYVTKYWVAYDAKENELGYIYRANGKNKYGSIAFLVGIHGASAAPILGKISLITDTETFKEKLEDGYVDPYNANPAANLENTKCGATHGATLIRDMVKEAKGVYNGSVVVTFTNSSGSSYTPGSVSYSSSDGSSGGSSSSSPDASAGGTTK